MHCIPKNLPCSSAALPHFIPKRELVAIADALAGCASAPCCAGLLAAGPQRRLRRRPWADSRQASCTPKPPSLTRWSLPDVQTPSGGGGEGRRGRCRGAAVFRCGRRGAGRGSGRPAGGAARRRRRGAVAGPRRCAALNSWPSFNLSHSTMPILKERQQVRGAVAGTCRSLPRSFDVCSFTRA